MDDGSDQSNWIVHQIGSWGALAAAVGFVAVSAYVFGVLAAQGFVPEMFDDHPQLHNWVADHSDAYRLTWVLVAFSQLVLLPVPYATALGVGHGRSSPIGGWLLVGAVLGTGAVLVAMVSPIILLSTSASLAEAFVAAPSAAAQDQVVLVSSAFSSLAKNLRLVAGVALGAWLAATGVEMATRRTVAGWTLAAIGLLTVAVVGHKIWVSTSPFEDFWGLALAVGYAVIGWDLRARARLSDR